MSFQHRRRALQEKLKERGATGMLLTQNVDLYYFTGSMQLGYAYIPAEGEPLFWVRRSVSRAREEADVPVEPLGSMRAFADSLARHDPLLAVREPAPVLAAEFDVMPVQTYQRLMKALPHVEWIDGSVLVREVRMLKSGEEAAVIRRAAALINEAFEHAAGIVRPGMREFELMAEIEHYLRRRGHMGLMRARGYNQEIVTGMVAAGAAAAMPTYFDGPAGGQGLGPASPQSAGRRPIGRNEPILVDIGCCLDGYVIDQTRTMVIGSLPDDLVRAYEVAESILRSAEEGLKPGTICEDLYLRALRQAEEAGLSGHFMGFGEDRVKFLGHGIGLEIDEFPVLARGFRYPLEPGMVIAVEPKFTFPGRGVVGIENSYLITGSGFEKLTVSPEGITVIPAPGE